MAPMYRRCDAWGRGRPLLSRSFNIVSRDLKPLRSPQRGVALQKQVPPAQEPLRSGRVQDDLRGHPIRQLESDAHREVHP